MGGKALKSPRPIPMPVVTPVEMPVNEGPDQAEIERIKQEKLELEEKEKRRKASIEESGRKATILAGDNAGPSSYNKLLGE